jgi:hypothetical protein
MLKNGSGALFELISENKEVRDVLGQTKFIQVYNMSNDVKHVLDPQFLGMASVEKLQAALKCVKREPKEDDTLVKMQNNKIKLSKFNSQEHKQNLISINDYIFATDKLLQLCEASEDLNTLYVKTFTKIDTYDEEEQCTVSPETSNGYVF